MPERLFKKINKSISPLWKVCFTAAVIVGLIAHLYKIVNWIPNWDSLVFRYDAQNMLLLGRPFLAIVCAPSSFYDLPMINGLIAVIFHALGAVVICKTLNVQKKITAVLIGAVVASFPTVTSIMMYGYVADGYSIAFFLSCLAAMFMTAEKPKYILAAVLITLSVGIYQAYVTVTIMLCLLKLIEELVFYSPKFTAILKKCGFMLLCGIGGLALYGIILKVILSVCSLELLDYQGINSSASFSAINIAGSLYTVKETFLNYFFGSGNGVNLHVVISVFILICTAAYFIKCIIKNKVYKNPANLLATIILTALLPVGGTALAFINANIDYHNLMLMGYVVFYLFFVILYEKEENKFEQIKRWVILITALVLVCNQVIIANVSYHKAEMAYEKSYGVLVRIADRIESTEGAEDCSKILVVGALEGSEAYSVDLTPVITGVTDGYIIRADDETVGQSVLCSALNDYCQKNYTFVFGSEKQELLKNKTVKEMGTWPAKNCVAVIEGTVVIKLGTEGEK